MSSIDKKRPLSDCSSLRASVKSQSVFDLEKRPSSLHSSTASSATSVRSSRTLQKGPKPLYRTSSEFSRSTLPDSSTRPLSKRRERCAKGALKYSNTCNKTAGLVTQMGVTIGIGIGAFVGGPVGFVAAGGTYLFSPKDKARRERVFERTSEGIMKAGGAAVGGPLLAAGALAGCAAGAPAAGYFAKKYLDKHNIKRKVWSYDFEEDETEVLPGEPVREPRLPNLWRT